MRRLAVFHGVLLTWLIFRSQSMAHLVELVTSMAAGDPAATCLIILGLRISQHLASRRVYEGLFLGLPLPVK